MPENQITNLDDVYCSMIHGGLAITLKSGTAHAQHCCLRKDFFTVKVGDDIWSDSRLHDLRQINKKNIWDPGCSNCQRLENAGHRSMRAGMNHGLALNGRHDLPGPARIDLMFDISCNLACRTCNPRSSTFWQKHLKDHGLWHQSITSPRKKIDVIKVLETLDLSGLRQLVFCGGETLLGQEYWDVARWIVDSVPDAKKHLTLCFQTNGTQTIQQRNYDIIEKCHLVKLHVSVDGIGPRFEYLRWPACWPDTEANIMDLRQNLPSNVMFVIEETVSIFNLAYLHETDKWHSDRFSTNREGDVVNLTRHMASGIYALDQCSQEYVDAISGTSNSGLIPRNWQENRGRITAMMAEIKQFDQFRRQDFQIVFPEIARFYHRFL